MNDDLDRSMRRLSGQPLPPRLQRLEPEVLRGISDLRINASTGTWRFAAVAVALAVGLGFGSSAAAWRDPPVLAADLSSGARLAPSNLLGASG